MLFKNGTQCIRSVRALGVFGDGQWHKENVTWWALPKRESISLSLFVLSVITWSIMGAIEMSLFVLEDLVTI